MKTMEKREMLDHHNLKHTSPIHEWCTHCQRDYNDLVVKIEPEGEDMSELREKIEKILTSGMLRSDLKLTDQLVQLIQQERTKAKEEVIDRFENALEGSSLINDSTLLVRADIIELIDELKQSLAEKGTE